MPSSILRRTMSRTIALLALFHGAATEAGAQRNPESDALSGVVVDASSGAEVPGAAVVLIERADPVIADRRGRFSFPDVRRGSKALIVTQLGYDTLRTEIEFDPTAAPVVLRLSPDPVVLERITAMADRFESRRRAVGSSVRVFDRLALQTSSSISALEMLRTRASVVPTRCPDRMALSPCARVRGRIVPVVVLVDGARIVSGLDMLTALRPDELYLVEVIGGGRAIRAYTNWYMETVADGRTIPAGELF